MTRISWLGLGLGFGLGLDDEGLLLRRLVEGELDVLEDEVELLAARRLEAQPRAVDLERTRRLLAAHVGAHLVRVRLRVRLRVRVGVRARVRVRVGAMVRANPTPTPEP